MKKWCIILLCCVFLLSGCMIINPKPSGSQVTSNDTSSNSLKVNFDIFGEYICFDDYYVSEDYVYKPAIMGSVTFYDGNRCQFFVNYLEGESDVEGTYSINGNTIYVKLDIENSFFKGIDPHTGEKYMDDQYVFTIVSNDEIIINNGFYAVNAGDSFKRQ